MRKRAIVFLVFGAAIALQLLIPVAAFAIGDDPKAPVQQSGEDRWVPSIAITGGATFQDQRGWVDSTLLEDGTPPSVPLQGAYKGDDLAVSPFVSASVEVMTPAFDVPTRPRLFFGAEILPTFASKRSLALDGDPECITGPEADAPCAVVEADELDPPRQQAFGQDAVKGEGSKTDARVDLLAYGANLGVAFPVRIGKRQVRIKPSVAWINYKVDAKGLVVDADCEPDFRCTTVTREIFGFPVVQPGDPGETVLKAGDSKRFNGIGTRFDIEMDAARWGPIGAALFLGGGAYYVVGDREIEFETTQLAGNGEDVANARFKVEVDPWLFRAHVGIRLQWLGSAK